MQCAEAMFVTGEPVLPVRAACHSPRPTDNIHHGRTEEMIHPGESTYVPSSWLPLSVSRGQHPLIAFLLLGRH